MVKKWFVALLFVAISVAGSAQTASHYDTMKQFTKSANKKKSEKKTDADKKEEGEKDKDNEEEEKEEDNKVEAYSNLIKKAKVTRRGVMDLHIIEGQVYLELPLDLLGREMLIGSTVTRTSDNGHSIVGSKPKDPLHVTFTLENDRVQMRRMSSLYLTDDQDVAEALKTGMSPAILSNMKVKAYNPDSTKVVIDVTDFFVSDNDLMTPFDTGGGLYSSLRLNKSFRRDLSYVKGIKAFEDNVSISSVLSYNSGLSTRKGITLTKDVPFTIEMTRSIIVLPEKTYRPRLADYRIGVFFSGREFISSDPNNGNRKFFVNRWDIQPKDSVAYLRGEKVEPVKPIVFYIDNTFPEWWKPYVKEGITQWNELFEEIGFKNVVQVRDFPTDDPTFDPDNLKYSCVRYAPISIQNAMGPSWMDPRSGEIIAASVYVYHDVIKLLGSWLFTQTSQADPSVRSYDIPREKLGDALRYVISHEVGHCLGLMHNMSASSTIPVDSLRSPSYTSKYGTTTSIMDYARFNYVAQPGDMERGVKLTPPRFGVYDKFAIEWTYKPIFEAKTPEEEAIITSKIITDAVAQNPMFRYGKQQFGGTVDPRAQSEDLGDNAVQATKYGIKNLKYILGNMHLWLADNDEDYRKVTNLYNSILRQYTLYISHVAGNIGGCYMNEVKSDDKMPKYAPISRAHQREAMRYLFEMCDDLAWLDEAPIRKRMSITGSVSNSFRNMIFFQMINSLIMTSKYEYLGDDPFTFEEGMGLLYDYVWNSKSGRNLTEGHMSLQEQYLNVMLQLGGLNKGGAGGSKALVDNSTYDTLLKNIGVEPAMASSFQFELENRPVSGFEWLPDNRFLTSSITPAHIYGYLVKLKKHLAQKKFFSSGNAKIHYKLLYDTLDKAL
ncbi:zinc-dependent metalloprotease [Porphyromonas levii]|uniref:zinc-dependent metalloprotease n=1 Tax=Porphyromonas levii TaxID=28114 RepID=UPI001BAC9D48|nr:zinc-dependent metalloprotease [Porphyromonas levii]MBR8703401.1 hypothetical protein [Porphyromonas levii]